MAKLIKIPPDQIVDFIASSGVSKIIPRISLKGWGALPLAILESPLLTEDQRSVLNQFQRIDFSVEDFEQE